MINVQYIKVKEKIKARLGELWWYTIVLFVAQQFGAVINAFIGLWLVPKYVPQKELGALLPLVSIGGLLGLPLAILMIPFMKFLTKYMIQKEYGKVKALLRDVFILAGITFLLIAGFSYLFMPLVFERMRVEKGLLPALIICSGSIGALAPVFNTALQALKKFRMMSLLGFAGAVIRLMTLLIALPIRGLSGYFVGQITPLIFGMLASLWALRKHLSSNVKMVPYWSEDWKPILKFTAWNTLLFSASQVMLTTEGFVIRHRLPDVESAGYYMISRFAEISFCISAACAVVLFPLISEQHEKGQEEAHQLAVQSTLVSFVAGSLAALAITFAVFSLFRFLPVWKMYSPFAPYVFPLCLVHVIRGTAYNVVSYKLARNEFGFIKWFVLCFGIETVLLYALTGYNFFDPWMPVAWKKYFLYINPCRLSVVLGIILFHSLLIASYVVFFIFKNYSRSRASRRSTF